jgi:predicted  nucleic acid-binding Zn-ribbon protein
MTNSPYLLIERIVLRGVTRVQTIENNIQALKENFTLTSRLAVEMKKIISELKQQLDARSGDIARAEKKHNNYVKLRETYKFDLEGVLASRFARQSMGNLQVNIKLVACPLCASRVDIPLVCPDEHTIEMEIKSLRNRISGIEEAIANIREQRRLLVQEQSEISNELEHRIKNFDQENAADISGLVQSIEDGEEQARCPDGTSRITSGCINQPTLF